MSERGSIFKRVLDRWIGIPICLMLSIPFDIFRESRSSDENKLKKRVGIFVFGAIGDALLASLIIDSMKKNNPTSHVILYLTEANKLVANLVFGFDSVSVININRPFSAVKIIRQAKLDMLVDSSQWIRLSSIIALLSGVKRRIGFDTPDQYRAWLYTDTVPHRADVHEVENFKALALKAGGNHDAFPLIREIHKSREAGELYNKFVVFHPWAAGYKSYLREWPSNYWKTLAKNFVSQGFFVLIGGGAVDSIKAKLLCDFIADESVVNVCAKYDLRGYAELIVASNLLVSVNTGIMHLAALLNVPVISLNGPTNSRRWGGVGSCALNLDVPAEQGGAFLNLGFEYPKKANNVMNKIDPITVILASKKLIDIEK